MPLSKPQQTIFDDKNRFRLACCGRRFGKSYLAIWEMARAARFPNQKIMYMSLNYRQAKNIILEDLREQLVKRRWVKKINESDLTLYLVNGSTITLRSADAAVSIRGSRYDFAVLDECAFYDRKIWTDIVRPTLSDSEGGALFISTPQGMGNWFYDMWMEAHKLEDWSAYQYTTLEGGQISNLEIEAARRDLDLATFKQEYEANWQSSGNIIFYAFDKDNIEKFSGEIPNQIHIGLDFNISKMTAVIGVKYKTGLHIIDEIVLRNTNTDEMCQAIKQKYPDKMIFIYPDSAGSQRKTSAGGNTDHTILQQYGFKVMANKANPLVKDRINAGNRLLCDAYGNRNLFVEPTCRETITAISKWEYQANTNIPKKDAEKGYDGVNDSWSYMVSYLYPIKPEYTQRTVKTYGAW